VLLSLNVSMLLLLGVETQGTERAPQECDQLGELACAARKFHRNTIASPAHVHRHSVLGSVIYAMVPVCILLTPVEVHWLNLWNCMS
jgi:hypothetical protein